MNLQKSLPEDLPFHLKNLHPLATENQEWSLIKPSLRFGGREIYLGLSPLPGWPVANEGLGWDPQLKMVHNPGGDWHPGRGDNLSEF